MFCGLVENQRQMNLVSPFSSGNQPPNFL